MSTRSEKLGIQSVPLARMLTSALPFMAVAMPAAVMAAVVTNTASITAPGGSIETNTADNTVVDADTLLASLVADPDEASGINGATGATGVVDVLDGDTIDGAPVTLDDIDIAVVTPATPVNPGDPVPTLNPETGLVDVPAGTPAGTYTITYEICETGFPTNCAQNVVTIEVEPPPITASTDSVGDIPAGVGAADVINVLSNDTLNDEPINPDDITLTVTTPATDPGVVLDPATGNVSVGPDVPEGTYVIEYQICEVLNPTNCADSSVTIVVEPALSAVQGTVYLDSNGDQDLDSGDEPRGGWIVEILRNGELIATTVTDGDGNYQFENLLSGDDYSIRFRNPSNNVVFGEIEDIELTANVVNTDQNLPIDPSGVIYNSVTRAPVAGAIATLNGMNGMALPDECFIDASQQNQLTDGTGEYRFDIIPGASAQCPTGETQYVISITPPTGFSFVSTVLLPQQGAFDPTGQTSPVRISPSSGAPTVADPNYYLAFLLEQGDPDVIFNHIPIDPFISRDQLIVTKTSTKRNVSTGDLVPYEITVRNAESVQRAGVTVVDLLPAGFKYVLGSASVNGVPNEPEATNSGRQLEWRNQTIAANATVSYNLVLTVGAGVTTGTKVNTGFGLDGPSGASISNRGSAAVRIVPSSVFDCSELIGKVYEDANRNGYQDEGEPGVPGVRLATVNGQLITTDEFGRYHIACAAVPDARIGSNFVLKLDQRTLPLGWQPTTDNPRSIRLTRGKMGELNFGVAPPEIDGAKTVDGNEGGEE
ncbi:MAG: SdrD B-like domain-containing protein [Erythrobacter sp.]